MRTPISAGKHTERTAVASAPPDPVPLPTKATGQVALMAGAQLGGHNQLLTLVQTCLNQECGAELDATRLRHLVVGLSAPRGGR